MLNLPYFWYYSLCLWLWDGRVSNRKKEVREWIERKLDVLRAWELLMQRGLFYLLIFCCAYVALVYLIVDLSISEVQWGTAALAFSCSWRWTQQPCSVSCLSARRRLFMHFRVFLSQERNNKQLQVTFLLYWRITAKAH